jgi:hypothetical protein
VTGSPSPGQLFDRQGCLTAAGLAAFQRAPAGRAPQEMAAHLAGCGRCQERLLYGMRGPATNPRARRAAPGRRLVWLAVLAIGGLLVLVAGLVAVRWLPR